jgi:tRNA threonylcarbamoyladenosine biosynthesis protein TsaB
MILLAIETSTPLTSVALHTPHGVSVREDDSTQHKASDVAMALIDELLKAQCVSRQQLQAVAYGSGPGGFTGLRTACAVAQGIAFGLQIPTIGITSLEAIAEQAYVYHQAIQVMAVMDARMSEVYAQALKRDAQGQWQGLEPMEVAPILSISWPPLGYGLASQSSGLASQGYGLASQGSAWQGAGNAWHSDDLAQAMKAATPAHINAPQVASVPHARDIVPLALMRASHLPHAANLSHMMAEPSYVRERVAQTTAERLAAKDRPLV